MKGKICILASIVLIALAVFMPQNPGDTGVAAGKVERIVAERLTILEKYADRALAESPYEWTDIGNLDPDMVIYRYVDDTIQCWINQFPLVNDDISPISLTTRLTNPRASTLSPLADVTGSIGFFNFGPGWYLAKLRIEGNVKVIYGLALANSMDTRSFNGVNPRFHLGDNYSIRPLASSEGSVVRVDGEPMFKVQFDSLSGSTSSNGLLIWLAFGFYLLGSILLLVANPTLRQMRFVIVGIVLAVTAMFLWGRGAQDQYISFSPTIYADGPVFYSLGAILLINVAITLLSASLFIVRKNLFDRVKGRRKALRDSALVCLGILLILLYTHFSLKSIILNSDISLELFKFETLSRFTFIVYASYTTMLLSVILLLSLLRPCLRLYAGLRFNPLSNKSRIIFSLAAAVYLAALTTALGFHKEQARIEIMSNRLAVDRDIGLELLLRRAETQIASDPIIASLTLVENGESSILNRLHDVHLSRLSQGYYISAHLGPAALSLVRPGEAISEGSNFTFCNGPMGFPDYFGIFIYNIPGYGMTSLVICVEPRPDVNDSGYSSLLGLVPPGRVTVPPMYSYAHYEGRKMLHFKGSYAYPTRMDDVLNGRIYASSEAYFTAGGYMHFVNRVAPGEVIIVSRERISPFNYLVFVLTLALLFFLLASVLALTNPSRHKAFGQNYYRTRINWVLMTALILTLMVMTVVSVIFVNRRNESNLYGMMSDKIGAIQSVLESGCRGVRNTAELRAPGVNILSGVSGFVNTDVSLYAADGRILMSTAPGIYENLMLGSRVNGDAYDNIVYQGHRYFIHRERFRGRSCYCMYAPLLSDEGRLLAIICSPYTDEVYGFERDVVTYSMMIVAIFLILLLLARFITSTIVDRMFLPLSEMGRKMSNAGLDSLEKISYDRDDEIRTLVQSYNRMVDELSESSARLAQAERDKAWSGMARQVAHEIKNPLTPMKLQIQRIIRLKEKNDASWQEKFDGMAKVLLDHIDILNDTANEFSTFAKLYTEDPIMIDLDAVLREEIAMFDNRDSISFEYFGLNGVCVMGPKPQITRVFVNLINNSVQALEGVENGIVRVALRNSAEDGWLDIVFEDNGAGVPEEHVGKLFEPNFTTKNGGSGLGLAISRSILERCGASISYSKSFALGGACFTIRYPRNLDSLSV